MRNERGNWEVAIDFKKNEASVNGKRTLLEQAEREILEMFVAGAKIVQEWVGFTDYKDRYGNGAGRPATPQALDHLAWRMNDRLDAPVVVRGGVGRLKLA